MHSVNKRRSSCSAWRLCYPHTSLSFSSESLGFRYTARPFHRRGAQKQRLVWGSLSVSPCHPPGLQCHQHYSRCEIFCCCCFFMFLHLIMHLSKGFAVYSFALVFTPFTGCRLRTQVRPIKIICYGFTQNLVISLNNPFFTGWLLVKVSGFRQSHARAQLVPGFNNKWDV